MSARDILGAIAAQPGVDPAFARSIRPLSAASDQDLIDELERRGVPHVAWTRDDVRDVAPAAPIDVLDWINEHVIHDLREAGAKRIAAHFGCDDEMPADWGLR